MASSRAIDMCATSVVPRDPHCGALACTPHRSSSSVGVQVPAVRLSNLASVPRHPEPTSGVRRDSVICLQVTAALHVPIFKGFPVIKTRGLNFHSLSVSSGLMVARCPVVSFYSPGGRKGPRRCIRTPYHATRFA